MFVPSRRMIYVLVPILTTVIWVIQPGPACGQYGRGARPPGVRPPLVDPPPPRPPSSRPPSTGQQILNALNETGLLRPPPTGHPPSTGQHPPHTPPWQPYPPYIPMQPPYIPTQPNYVPPVVSNPPVISNFVPGNVVPSQSSGVQTNDLDIQVTPAGNQVADVRFSLTDPERRQLADDLAGLEDQQLDKVAQDLGSSTLSQQLQDDLVRDAANRGNDTTALRDALRSGDPDAIRREMSRANFQPGEIDRTAAKAEVSRAMQGLRDAVRNGTPEDRARARDELEARFRDALKAQGVSNAGINTLTGKLDNALDQQDRIGRIKDALTNPPGLDGGIMPPGGLPPDTVVVVHWPPLPDGETVVLGSDTVVVGGSGTMGIGVQGDQSLGLPLVQGQPVPAADPSSVTDTGVVLKNPEKSPGTVNYTVNDQNFSMAPGYNHALPAGRAYRLQFDRGGGNGMADYTLNAGTYEFAADAKGWEAWRVTYKVILDNSVNGHDFHYVVNKAQATVKARRGQELTSDYPILVVFDPGNGEPVYRALTSGTYRVGVSNGGLGLFPVAERKIGRAREPRKVGS